MIKNPPQGGWTPPKLALDRNTELVVRKKPQKPLGSFQAIGKLSTLSKPSDSDVFKALALATGHAVMKLFHTLLNMRNENSNVVAYPLEFETLGSSEYQGHQRRIKKLKDAGLIASLPAAYAAHYKRDNALPKNQRLQMFMVNPNLVRCWDFEDQQRLWNQITNKQ